MILDLEHFITRERPYWDELEQSIKQQEGEPGATRSLDRVRRFHYLFQRASADLSKLATFSGQPEVRQYLERLVARAYVELHGEQDRTLRFSPWEWISRTWPSCFRRHAGAFWLAVSISMLGALFGGFVLDKDRENMYAMIPPQFAHVLQDPSERVAKEEKTFSGEADPLDGARSSFAGHLMMNNIKVAIKAMAFGMTYGVLTIVVLFYNGVILGVVGFDYVRAGETEFLLGWLLPHGVPELTAIFMGGQGGLMIARAIIGWGTDLGFRARFRAIRADLATVIGGCIVLLIYAGIIEAFFSQYHYPVIAYSTKIAFGVVELVLLVAFLKFAGRKFAK